MWLSRRTPSQPIPSTPTEYPSGICVVTEKGRFYINGKLRHRITTDRVFDSWSFPIVINTSEAAVSKYLVVKSLGFRDGTFVKDITTGKMYIISKNLRRHIESPDVLTRLGKKESDAILVSKAEIELQKEGEVLK